MKNQQKQEPSTHKRVRIRNIRPNPFRHLDRYPLHADKVETLRASIRKTGWWKNVVARNGPDGTVELAYGHHRLEALKLEFSPDDEVDLIVEDLDDATMLQIMANENMEEFSSSAWVEMETVRAVVEAYAEGKIQLDAPSGKAPVNQLRQAPSFVMGDVAVERGHIYTSDTVADFLGWVRVKGDKAGKASDKVVYALSALELIEQGHLSHADFKGMNHTRMRTVVMATKASVKKTEQMVASRKIQAEQASKRAEEAAKRKKEARAKQLKLEAEIKASRDIAERKRKEEEVREQEQVQIKSEREKVAAKRQKKAKEAEAEKIEEKRADTASKVGTTVAQKLREGEIGVEQVMEERLKIDCWKKEEKTLYAHDVMSKLRTELARTMVPGYDKTADKVKEAIRLSRKGAIPEREMEWLAAGLEGVVGRCEMFIEKIRKTAVPGETEPDTMRLDTGIVVEPAGPPEFINTGIVVEPAGPPEFINTGIVVEPAGPPEFINTGIVVEPAGPPVELRLDGDTDE